MLKKIAKTWKLTSHFLVSQKKWGGGFIKKNSGAFKKKKQTGSKKNK